MRAWWRDQGMIPGVASSLMIVSLCGCGASPSSPVPVPVSPNHFLAGNWLLSGSLPVSGFSTGSTPGLAVSFDVTGSTVTAAANLIATSPCATLSTVFGGSLAGTVASDGTFTLTSPVSANLVPLSTLTVQGTVPASADAPWKGTYVFSSTIPSLNNNPACTINESGAFTATAVQDVTGTYSGGGTFPATAAGTPAAPFSVSLNLQQGATLYSLGGRTAVASRLALSGSIQAQGLGCFTSGTMSTLSPSEISGDRIQANFVANDGTTASLSGNIVDTGAMSLSINSIVVRGAQCNESYEFFLTPLIVQR